MTTTTTTAESDLEWFFRLAAADTGFHAQAYESGGGGAVFDDAASHRAHLGLRTPKHREAVVRHARVLASLAQLSDAAVAFLRLAFESRGYPFTSPLDEVQVLAACRRKQSNVHVLSVLLVEGGLVEARMLRDHPQTPSSWAARLAFVEATVRAAHGREDRLPAWFLRAIERAASAIAALVTSFETARRARISWEEEEKYLSQQRRRERLERDFGLRSAS